jgi:SAM-dependent methyltransferase
MIDDGLLGSLLARSPHEPATCLWRAVELRALIDSGYLPLDGRLLDLGCGDGGVTATLAAELGARWTVVGLDPDLESVTQARRSPVYDLVHHADARTIPEPDAAFDIVFANSVLEHVVEIDAVLHEVARILRRGGRCVFTVPSDGFHAVLGGPGLAGWLAGGTRDRGAYLDRLDARLDHRRYWSTDEWRAALANAGLTLERSLPYLAASEAHRWETISNLTGGVLSRLAGTTPLVAERRLRLGPLAAHGSRLVAKVLPPLLTSGLRPTGGHGGLALQAAR